MPAQIEQTAGPATVARPVSPRVSRAADSGRRRDRFDLGVLAVFAAVSMWVLALDLWQVIVNGRTWTGTDGVFIVDQLQYLSWIREASRHVLISNLFVLHPTPADYFQPAMVVSGGLTALGVAPWLALLLWKPVAVGGLFYVSREWINRSVRGAGARRAALVLALFFGSFTVVEGTWSVLGDLFPGFLSWGYYVALLGMACMAGAVLSYDRAWHAERISWWPGVLGALASLMHPWNGELVIVVVLGAEAMMRLRATRPWRQLKLPLITVVMTGVPLLYYGVLGKTDPSWELARDASKHSYPLWSVLVALAPLLLPALLAYRRGRPRTLLAAATLFWPVATAIVYVVSGSAAGATPLHAFQGITIPLAVLAVQGVQYAGWGRLRRGRLLAVVAVALLTVPTTVYELKLARQLAAPTAGNANFVTSDELAAVDYLARDPTPGGVVSQPYLGTLVPEKTGRHSYVGDCLWSEPDCPGRTNNTFNLFGGYLSDAQAQSFVAGTGARFLLADCTTKADLVKQLGPQLQAVRRFGCAAVYTLRPPA